VLGKIELVEVRAHRFRGEAFVAELRDGRVPVTLRELPPVRAENEPVVDHFRQSASNGASDQTVEL